MAQKPSIPKGTRDFSPTEVAKRTYIFSTIRNVFETFGFQPIETPSFENSDTLMGKYGDEGDRLIFKILNSGDYFKDIQKQVIENLDFANIFYQIFDAIQYIEDKSSEFNYEEYINEYIETYNELTTDEKKMLLNYFTLNKKEFIAFYENEEVLDNEEELEDKSYFKENFIEELVKPNIDKLLNSNKLTASISEKALRYDLTVPFARYVVQHQNEIEFPFKRYQMQPVWRADRPQKGRFREFYQCDADVVGSKGLWQEVEFVQLYDAVFSKLRLFGTTIKLNNRKILAGIAEIIGEADKLIDFTVALDKLDKIGAEGVTKEMLEKGISETAIEKVQPLFSFNGTNQEKLNQLQVLLADSVEGTNGVNDLRFVIDNIEILGLQSANLEIDVTLARGLNYYTGAIYEVSAPNGVQMGSIGGGGRYDDLTGIFGLKDMSGVGISFGLDRIYLVLEELNLFDAVELPKPKVLFVNFGDKEAAFCMKALVKLREHNIKSELYPDSSKMKKQMNYANRREIPFVVMVGSSEIEKNIYTVKIMQTGEQQECSLEELLKITQ
ncbi:histidine--tRNA ligase [Lutibacter sp.]|uniref:histidine--tRNA ligase n=1 Tax=Lutibacter sp. TaxID=1925666 RepID=UPI001A1DE420|nr:histidine--tRNA ligase [Lutibacter sp.]MBI9041426.1 histidine--tRNA ligase [Lutibacter sp.]